MKILHTSDWHIGQKFMGRSREEDHKAFFVWLDKTIKEQNIDILIVAGDIFDTGTPPNYALELYYNFLKQLLSIPNLYVIITAGNHDAISTLKTSKKLLESMNIFVITSGEKDENELIPIYKENRLKAIVCAVPFLRDSVVRGSISGQTVSEKENALNIGIKKHYTDIYEKAIELSDNKNIPIIATGHLTTVGGRTSEGERDIYIGGTVDIGSDFLGKLFDFVALGHLHINQTVDVNHVRYSGSPIPLSFSESKQKKKINIIEFNDTHPTLPIVKEIEIPLYRKLQVIKGDFESIQKELKNIEDKTVWIEIHLKDNNPIYTNQVIREYANTMDLTILAIKIDNRLRKLEAKALKVTSLDELTPNDVFQKRLELEEIKDEKFMKELTTSFNTIIQKVVLG